MIRFLGRQDDRTVVVRLDDDHATLAEVLDAALTFLRACGYCISAAATLDVIEPETLYATPTHTPD